ncbi:MAG: glycosyl transferase [Cyanobacteria bacterium DS2.3.42]|nr:glycosyl transferase [Cyanobacteria bacterium DS2.3.42]
MNFLFKRKTSSKQLLTIVIDGVFFQFRDAGGIARVWASVLEEWSKTEFAKSLVVMDRDGASPKFPGIRYEPFKTYYSRSAAAETFLIEEFCAGIKADLFISTFHTTPLETPSLLLVHDLVPELAECFDQTWLREKRYCTYHADAYLTASNNTLRDLNNVYPFSNRLPTKVIANGVASTFEPVNADAVRTFKEKWKLNSPYFLLVGRRGGHKNARLFFEAFDKLPDKERFSIVCCQGNDDALEPEFIELARGSEVKLISLTDQELNAAYCGAVSLVYPSKYEGFGLPLLEAMAAGCPVITCRNASIPEVGGDAAMYVDDTDVQEMVRALVAVQTPDIREKLINAGFAQARRFSWSRMANEFCSYVQGSVEGLAKRKGNKDEVERRISRQRRWRDLRSYQCQPHATLEGEKALEEAWRKSVEEDGCRLLN